MVTTPWPGRDDDSRFPLITVSVYRVSPWYSGCGKETSVSPSCAMMVPWVSCDTDWPTTGGQREHRVDEPLAERLPGAPGRIQVQGLGVHGDGGEQDVVRLR
jgi:hypothetical protein